jgi:hypothetical protein
VTTPSASNTTNVTTPSASNATNVTTPSASYEGTCRRRGFTRSSPPIVTRRFPRTAPRW